jgi:arylsulfatase A-like enzyme
LPKNFLPQHPFDHGNLDGRDERLLPRPHSQEQVRQLIAMYYRVITHMDQHIGRILRALDDTGQMANTIVIFSSDHGLAVGSHGLRGKQNMYEHTIGIPLILRGPGVPKGQRRTAQVYLRDLYPTICDLTGLRIPATVEGRSFTRILSGEKDKVYGEVFCHCRDKQRMIRTDRWKLIHYPHIDRWQLFDLRDDPHEVQDLADDTAYTDVVARMKAKLMSWQQQVGDPLLKQ